MLWRHWSLFCGVNFGEIRLQIFPSIDFDAHLSGPGCEMICFGVESGERCHVWRGCLKAEHQRGMDAARQRAGDAARPRAMDAARQRAMDAARQRAMDAARQKAMDAARQRAIDAAMRFLRKT